MALLFAPGLAVAEATVAAQHGASMAQNLEGESFEYGGERPAGIGESGPPGALPGL